MATMGPEERERFARRDESSVISVSGPRRDVEPERHRAAKVVAGGSMSEAVCGAGAVVLAIIALAGVMPLDLAAVAAIVCGAALLAQGGAIAARASRRYDASARLEGDTRAELSGGMGLEFLGGAAGVVLGILAFIGIGSLVLLPVAVIVLGGALLLGSPAVGALGLASPPGFEGMAHLASTSAGVQVLAGVGAVVLGILALLGIAPVVLCLAALLALGAAVLMTGAAVSGRVFQGLRR